MIRIMEEAYINNKQVYVIVKQNNKNKLIVTMITRNVS